MMYCIQCVLFWTPWSPFETSWQLREDYKQNNLRNELASELGRFILILALINICLAPIMFLWQLLFVFYGYGDVLKRNPGQLGIRNWSLYAAIYFRHFNELDHELHARLTRAYRPATKYLQAFKYPIMAIVGQYIGFACGSLFTVIVALTLYDEDVIAVEHVITIMTLLGTITAFCRSFIPDDTTMWCPEELLEGVVMHTHYLPSDWKNNAHSTPIIWQFKVLFQMSVIALLDDLLSPLLTPYFMITWVYPRTLEIVDFLRNFSVTVVGVGDVCSFAEMDITKHGNPQWQDEKNIPTSDIEEYFQAENGKLELSLVHFATTNPNWIPPPEAQDFLDSLQEEAEPLLYDSDTQIAKLPAAEKKEKTRESTGVRFDSSPKQPAQENEIKSKSRRSNLFLIKDQESSSEMNLEVAPSARGKSSVGFRTGAELKSNSATESTAAFGALRKNMKSVAWLEGPDVNASAAMARGTLALHKRNYQSRMNLEAQDPPD